MKHIYAKDLHPFKEKIMALFAKIEKGPEKDYIESAIAYLFAAGHMSNAEAFADELINRLDNDEIRSYTMTMTIAEELRAAAASKARAEFAAELIKNLDDHTIGNDPTAIAKGLMAKGEAKGKAKGQLKKQKQMALNALKHGLSIELIAQLTELNHAEIEMLKLDESA